MRKNYSKIKSGFYSWRASRNLSCSGSVQLSLDLVIVYGFRIFFPGSSVVDAVVVAVVTEAKGPSPGTAMPLGSKQKPSGGFGFLDTIQMILGLKIFWVLRENKREEKWRQLRRRRQWTYRRCRRLVLNTVRFLVVARRRTNGK